MKSSTKIILSLLLSSNLLNADALSFTKAYSLALVNANSIKSSEYLAKSDKEKINQEEAQLYPQLRLNASYKLSNYQYHKDYPSLNNHIRQNQFNANITLKQAIYVPETYSRIDIQESRSKYSEVKVKLEKERLALDVFKAYLDLLKSRTKIELLESYLTASKIKYTKVKKQFEKNLSNKMDLLEFEVELNNAKIELSKEEKFFDAYKLRLEQFIGTTEYELPNLKGSEISLVNMLDQMRFKIMGTLRSLKVEQAKVAADISQNNIENAKNGHLPSVTLDASFSKYEMNEPDVTAPYSHVEFAMININLPLYSGGYTSSKVASSKLEYKAALEEIKRVEKETDIEYHHNLALFNASIESVTLYKETLASTQLYVKSVEEGYKYGLKSIIDLTEAQSKFYEVKYKYVENIYEMINSYITLITITHNFDGISLLDELVEE